MQRDLQMKFNKDKKMKEYLIMNSYWYKELNRDSANYKIFEQAIKDQYKLRMTDKANAALDNIDLISSVLDALK